MQPTARAPIFSLLAMLRQKLESGWRQLQASEQLFMVIAGLMVGILGGLGATGFRLIIEFLQKIFWQTDSYSLAAVLETPFYWRLLVPAIGGLFCGLLVYYGAREARGVGVPEVMEAVIRHSGFIRARVVLVKILASSLAIASGGSVGREGPIVQIGSALGSTLGQALRVKGNRLKTLVGCGAAAGVAATFNAPIAGAIFAGEVILGNFTVTQFSPIVIASVTATVLSRYLVGNYPAFEIPHYHLVSAWEFIPYTLLGVLAGLVAILFGTAMHRSDLLFAKINVPDYAKVMIGGLMVGGLGLAFPQIYGVGYETISWVLWGKATLPLVGALILVKLLATSISLGSGSSGGEFAPTLFIGATLGGCVGLLVHRYFPEWTASSGAYATVGMGALLAGTIHAPITAILIIFEMTGSYQIIAPLMVACVISLLLSRGIRRESIYTAKLLSRGIDVTAGRDVNMLRHLHVEKVIDRNVAPIAAGTPFPRVLQRVSQSTHQYFFVVDTANRLTGYLTMNDLKDLIRDETLLTQLVLAQDITHSDLQPVYLHDNLDLVMHQFGRRQVDELPVVDPKTGRFLGTVHQSDVLDAYNHAIFESDLAGGMHSLVTGVSEKRPVEVSEGVQLMEIELPPGLEGHSIRELEIRRRFQIEILLIKKMSVSEGQIRNRPGVFAHPNYVFKARDRLLVLGAARDIARFRNA